MEQRPFKFHAEHLVGGLKLEGATCTVFKGWMDSLSCFKARHFLKKCEADFFLLMKKLEIGD